MPACWLAESYPHARVFGIEPAHDRVRAANRALDGRGMVIQGFAPDLPDSPTGADGAFMLDMMHYLSDKDLYRLLQGLHRAMKPGGVLIIRAVMVPTRRFNGWWWLERLKGKLGGPETWYRSSGQIQAALTQCGFGAVEEMPSGRHGELLWFKSRGTPSDAQDL